MAFVCGVCGDRAISKNFGAYTCAPCKAFFRRNAPRNKSSCFYGGDCDVTHFTRKFCQKCRLNKCYAIGMRKYEMSYVWTPDSEDTPNDNTMISHKAIDQHIINDLIDPRLADQLANKELFLNNQQKFKLATVSIVRHISNFSICFNEFEINKIRELLTAMNWIREPTGGMITGELADPMQYKMTMATRFNKLIQNFTKMTKQLNSFNNLCGNDMIALIKYGCVENIMMRSVQYYNHRDRYWTICADNKSSFILKMDFIAKCEPLIGDSYIRYFDIMCPEWDSDRLIVDLLTAIVLFDPNRPNLKHRHVIKFEQNLYMYLLLRYILLKYCIFGSEMAKLKFLRIMSSIKEINTLGVITKLNWSHANPGDVGPFISEILDLDT
ncbi:unnamed protein product [Medioppia subpectinata]|uniref:Uncharacterized protein n=1 Tax=Medioppia subpectinata TaxID=1979941 RepID=A0A7R9PZW6_9ACAR|nr:unnamed protein product [Medioppia subpectinata]CAG2107505.1 unnamed protein product [Medioppia subpectinata]